MNEAEFRAALLDPGLPVPSGLAGPEGRAAGRRFDVYRNNVMASLSEALRQAFPVIRRLVGEAFFTALAREHARAHPPASPMLMSYGEAMPAFLEAFPAVAHLGYLPDIARLELALRQSYHAADAAPVPPGVLRTLDPEAFLAGRIMLAPAVRLVRSRWPIHAIWSANTRDTPVPRSVTPQNVLILRRDYDPEPHLLPEGAGPFIAALLSGQTVSAALDAGCTFDLAATLGLLIGGNAIVGLPTGE